MLNCINWNPVPRGTRKSFSRGAFERQALASTDSGLQLDLGIALNDCLSEDPAPAALFSRAEEKKLSDNVIEEAFISSAIARRALFHGLRSPLGVLADRITESSSTNAVSFSSVRTTKRFPSSPCASAIQIIRGYNPRLQHSPNSNGLCSKSYFPDRRRTVLTARTTPQQPECACD